MQVRVTARHCEIAPDLKDHVEEKVEHLTHYFDRVDEAHVVFTREGHRHISDLTVHAAGVVASSEQQAEDFRTSFDRALDKVERQIRRHKERVRHHKGANATAQAAELVDGTAPEEVGIVPEEIAASSMGPDEAFRRLEDIGARFLVFINEDTGKVNVIYRRDDGDYGLVEPQE